MRIFALVVLQLMFFSPAKLLARDEVQNTPTQTNVESIQTTINTLSLEQKVGQLFILGYRGTSMNRSLKKLLMQIQPGAIIAFKRNIKTPLQMARMNFEAQKITTSNSPLPLFTMIDQEGGSVSRIRTKPQAPSALAIGQTQQPQLSVAAGAITGKILNLLGFNFNLAPVVDLSNPHEKNFVGNRSFGNDPHKVTTMAEAFAVGLQKSNVIPTIKHFPGHGGIIQDSHKLLPKKLETLEELEKRDLVPFKHFADSKLPSAIMVAHVAFPKIDPSNTPATFSPILINDILRKKYGYDGLIITDDLEMQGANSVGRIGERAVRAIEAGCDMVMVAWSLKRQRKAFKGILAAVQDGRLTEERINESLRKIIHLKQKLTVYSDLIEPESAQIKADLSDHIKELRKVTHKISDLNFKKGVEKYSDLRNTLDKKEPLVVFSADYRFYEAFKIVKPRKTKFFRLKRKQTKFFESIFKKHSRNTAIYYVTGRGTAKLINNISSELKAKTIIVNTTHPGMISDPDSYKAVLNMSSRDYIVGKWLAEHLIKGIGPEIRSPGSEETALLPKRKKKIKKPRSSKKKSS